MLTPNADLMRQAREALKGKWGVAVVGNLIFLAVSAGSQFLPWIGGVANLVLSGPLVLGLALFFLALSRGQEVQVSRVFDGFQRFVDALVTYLLMVLLIFLWSLLLIIPGIMAALSYALTFFLMADQPGLKGMEALKESQRLMKDNRWKLFCLFLRFLGWFLLGALTMGIGFLWILPYVQTTAARFYDDVRGTARDAAETGPRSKPPVPPKPPQRPPQSAKAPKPADPVPVVEPPKPAPHRRARLCLSCHRPIEDPNARACPECGFPLMEVPGAPPAPPAASPGTAPAASPKPMAKAPPSIPQEPVSGPSKPLPEPMDLEATVMEGPPRLVSLSAEGKNENYALKLPVVKIGRKNDNDLAFPLEMTISGRHCEIYREGKEFFIKDLGSTNGVLVNARKVEVSPLKEGDEIKLGNKVFKFTRSA